MKETLNWGVIGTGGIATDFANALTQSNRCRIVNVTGLVARLGAGVRRAAARIPARAPRWTSCSPTAVEAVYIATPHPSHEERRWRRSRRANRAVRKADALDAAASAR